MVAQLACSALLAQAVDVFNVNLDVFLIAALQARHMVSMALTWLNNWWQVMLASCLLLSDWSAIMGIFSFIFVLF